MNDRRWWELPNLFDLCGGPLLDKGLLARGVRSGSMRRWAIGLLLFRLTSDPWISWPAPTWQYVVLWALAVLGLDLMGAIAAAPREAMRAIGQAVGSARGAMTSGYRYAQSAFGSYASPRATLEEDQTP